MENLAADTNELVTPPGLYEALAGRYGPFDVDLAASDHNKKCEVHFTKGRSSLAFDWSQFSLLRLWCNPPYSRGMQSQFVGKWKEAIRGKNRVTYLVQARVGSEWWWENVWSGRQILGDESVVLRGRGESWQARVIQFEGIGHGLELGILRGRLGFYRADPHGKLVLTEHNAEFESAFLHYRPLR